MTTALTIDRIVSAILDGEADGEEQRIYDALKTRHKVVDQHKAATFRAGDRVKFNDRTRPVYLRGMIGTVESISSSTASVLLDESAGRFRAGVSIRTSLSLIDKIAARPAKRAAAGRRKR